MTGAPLSFEEEEPELTIFNLREEFIKGVLKRFEKSFQQQEGEKQCR
jgi:hypothetical protein